MNDDTTQRPNGQTSDKPQTSLQFQETELPDGRIEVQWQANVSREWQRVLSLIKNGIPNNARKYNPANKSWIIAASHRDSYESIKQACLTIDDEIIGDVDEQINEEVYARVMGVNLLKLPPSMRDRAVYAVKATLGIIDTAVQFCVSENSFAAWNEERAAWFYDTGRYSSISPKERDRRAIKAAFDRTQKAWESIEHTFDRLDMEQDKYTQKYMGTEAYQKMILRGELLAAANYQCTVCGRMPDDLRHLHMHRVTPGKNGGLYVAENIVIVCTKCHKRVEGMTWEQIASERAERFEESNNE